jgi:2-methylisocitrate lyase-like PEP mutase family enzyme
MTDVKRDSRAAAFRALHRSSDPLILYNVWDAGSARAVERAGAKGIATGSWSVAEAHGHLDGEQLPLDLVLANAERIVAAVTLPVSIDLESGYGQAPADVAASVLRLAASGAVGCNIEDGADDGAALRPIEDQCERLTAARGADAAMFINARVDLFLGAAVGEHEALFEAALERSRRYLDAGADGIFAPGLVDERLIGRFCEMVAGPVNILVMAATPPAQQLARLGVARISHGPGPYRRAMAALEDAARKALRGA